MGVITGPNDGGDDTANTRPLAGRFDVVDEDEDGGAGAGVVSLKATL